jgi:hypothetical protein
MKGETLDKTRQIMVFSLHGLKLRDYCGGLRFMLVINGHRRMEGGTHFFDEIYAKVLRMIQQYQFSGAENLFRALVRESIENVEFLVSQFPPAQKPAILHCFVPDIPFSSVFPPSSCQIFVKMDPFEIILENSLFATLRTIHPKLVSGTATSYPSRLRHR